MFPDPNRAGAPRLLLMVGAPPLGPLPQRISLRSALRIGREALAALAWPAPPAPDDYTHGRDCALEEG
jgi:hypothetical protein